MPTFVVADVARIPSLSVDENDSRILAVKVSRLEDKLNELFNIIQNRGVSLSQNFYILGETQVKEAASPVSMPENHHHQQAIQVNSLQSYANILKTTPVATVKKPRVHIGSGSEKVNLKVKAAKAVPTMVKKAVYQIDNLDSSVDKDAITDHLKEIGVCAFKVNPCKSCVIKDDNVKAMHVCIARQDINSFLNPANWDVGVVIRPGNSNQNP